MNDDWDDIAILIIVCGLFVAALILVVVAVVIPDERTTAVCEYLGGNVEGSVCIVDGKVVSTESDK